ncbi:MAG: SulP family inorganic anion transporter [Congregibacter sp.]
MDIARNIRHDLPAGIVVLFVAVPLCLGIALASGAPLFAGLIAGIVGGLVVGLLSRSALGVSGPAAGLAVIVFESIQVLGSFQTFLLAVVIAGLIQIVLGFAKAGVLGYFFPSAAVKGMLSGIGLLIILKQIPHALGWDSDPIGDLQFSQPDGENTVSGIAQALQHIEPGAVVVSTLALAIIIFWDQVLGSRGKFFRLLQGPVVAVLFGIAYQLVMQSVAPGWALGPEHLVVVPVFDDFAALKEVFVGPDWSQLTNPVIYTVAATIAVVASLETLLCLEATDKLDPQKRVTPANRELLAQGAGNTISGLLGGLPITQVIVRSSANIQSGAQSKLSAIIHGLLLLVFTIALPKMLNLIPLSVLASVLFVVGYKLAKPSLFVAMYRLGPQQFVPFMVTIIGIITTDLLTGVFLGVAVAVIFILYRSYRNSHFLHTTTQDNPGERHTVRIKLAEEVTFLNRGAILRELSEIPDNSIVVIDQEDTVSMDNDVVEVIEDFEISAKSRDIIVQRLHPSALA